MSEINTTQMRIAMQDENYRNVWLNGTTHFDGCEYTHYPCAVLKLCDEVDALRAELAAARAEKLECIKSLEYFVNRMQEERDERIRLEERLKMAEATVKFMVEDSGYDSEEAPDEQA